MTAPLIIVFFTNYIVFQTSLILHLQTVGMELDYSRFNYQSYTFKKM